MFDNSRYLTCGVDSNIPLELQLFLWECVERMPAPKDYLQVYFNMHEEILLAYCGCYGVDSADVELLLEYGYTCDEIEEMPSDHSLLREALRDVKYMCGEDVYESYCGAF
ncbi:DUF960 family protein [Ruminococcus sp.]|uniref:DUF960 family protein n=1 Tax=Ruminococcus sp. TaxID=41978 RepID=UPI0025E48243|nr:DUF960 family protein [Ruminococcus sp.]